MIYFLAITLYTGAMILVYLLFLRNKPLYLSGRIYLLASSLLPLVLPFASAPVALQQSVQKITSFQFALPEVVIPATAQQQLHAVGTVNGIYFVYCAVALLLFIWYMVGIIRIRQIIANSVKQKRETYTLITDTGYGPGSFGQYIFFPGNNVDETVLAHECVHVNRRHTADIILLSLLQSVFWPNFFLIFIKRELKEIHEFEADAALKVDTAEYARLMLSSVFETSSVTLMHSFINHPLKRRIMMLSKKNGKASPSKAIVLVSLSLCVIFAAGAGIQSCRKKAITQVSPGVDVVKETVDGPVVTSADVMPRFKKGSVAEYLANNLKYPEDARKNKVEGKVVVKFMITSGGTVAQAAIVKSPDSSLSKAALAVIEQMPAWEPAQMIDGKKVNIWFYMPVLFKLE